MDFFVVLVMLFFLAGFASLLIGLCNRNARIIILGCVCYILCIISTMIISVQNEWQRNQQKASIPILIEHGYELYIDGRQVELEHINLDQYTININDDTKVIILDK